MPDLKNKIPKYLHEEADSFPDLTRMRIEWKIENAVDPIQQELCSNLLYLYDRGEIDVSQDPWTGELLFQAAYLN